MLLPPILKLMSPPKNKDSIYKKQDFFLTIIAPNFFLLTIYTAYLTINMVHNVQQVSKT